MLECRVRILIMPNKHPVNLLGSVLVDASQAGGVDRRDVTDDGAVTEIRSLGQSVNIALRTIWGVDDSTRKHCEGSGEER